MRRLFLCFIGIIGLSALCLCSPDLVMAEGPVIHIDASDTPLVIHGTLDGRTTAFSGNVRLTITGGDADELQLLPADLHHTNDAGMVIDRSNVTIPAGISLSDGHPRDVRVTVSNVTRPGDYTGELKFLLPDQTEADALIVPLELHIEARPDVKPVADNLTFQVVRCTTPIECAVATWLLPDNVVRDDWVVQLDNQIVVPVEVTDVDVVMRGERTGSTLRANDVTATVPYTLPAGQVESIALTIHRNRLSPDRYRGIFRFRLEGRDDPVIVNVDLDVRNGPLWPSLIILVGIIVGRLVRGMETPAAKQQVKFLPRLYRLQADANGIRDTDAAAYLSQQLRTTRHKLEAGGETEETLVQALSKLEAHIGFLTTLESLERQLDKSSLDALSEELKPRVQSARQALLNDRVEEAERLRREVETRLRQAQEDGTMGAMADPFGKLLGTLRDSGTELTAVELTPRPRQPGGAHWGWLAQLMAALSGARLISADVRYWLIRPLLWLVLLVALALLGLQVLYVNAGATFGAAGLYDYLGLFLWGLSADVAQRTLQSLQLPQ